MVIDHGDDQRQRLDRDAVAVEVPLVVEPRVSVLQPGFHGADMVVVVVVLPPTDTVTYHGGGDDVDETVHHANHAVVVKRGTDGGQFLPTVHKVTPEEVVLVELMPEFGPGVVAVVELQHVVAGTSHRPEIVAVGKVEVPNGTGAELAATVLVEEGALLVDVHVG